MAKPIEYVQTVRIYEIGFADPSLCKCQGIRLKIHFCQVEIHSFKKGFPQKNSNFIVNLSNFHPVLDS